MDLQKTKKYFKRQVTVLPIMIFFPFMFLVGLLWLGLRKGFINTLTSPFGFFYGLFLVTFAIMSYWGIYTIVHAASMLIKIKGGKIPAKKEINVLVVKLGKNKLKVKYKRPYLTSQIFVYYNGKEVFKKTLVGLISVYITILTFWRKKSYDLTLPNKNKVKLVIYHHVFSFTEKRFTVEVFVNGKSKGKFDTWDFPEGIKNIKEDLKL